jgi:hypothetical protein
MVDGKEKKRRPKLSTIDNEGIFCDTAWGVWLWFCIFAVTTVVVWFSWKATIVCLSRKGRMLGQDTQRNNSHFQTEVFIVKKISRDYGVVVVVLVVVAVVLVVPRLC